MRLTVQRQRRIWDIIKRRFQCIAAKSAAARLKILDSRTAAGAAERLRGVSDDVGRICVRGNDYNAHPDCYYPMDELNRGCY